MAALSLVFFAVTTKRLYRYEAGNGVNNARKTSFLRTAALTSSANCSRKNSAIAGARRRTALPNSDIENWVTSNDQTWII